MNDFIVKLAVVDPFPDTGVYFTMTLPNVVVSNVKSEEVVFKVEPIATKEPTIA